MAKSVNFIAALDNSRGIGKNNSIPWDLPEDKKFFRNQVADQIIIMGWNEFVSNKQKPHRTARRNIIVSHRQQQFDGVEIIDNPQEFIDRLKDDVWVIGGGNIFDQLIDKANRLFLTRLDGDFGCDVFFPEFENKFELKESSDRYIENGVEYVREIWVTKLG